MAPSTSTGEGRSTKLLLAELLRCLCFLQPCILPAYQSLLSAKKVRTEQFGTKDFGHYGHCCMY